MDTLRKEVKFYREIIESDSYLKTRFISAFAKRDKQIIAARTIQTWFRVWYELKQKHALIIQTWHRRCIHYVWFGTQKNAACRIQRFFRKRAQIRQHIDLYLISLVTISLHIMIDVTSCIQEAHVLAKRMKQNRKEWCTFCLMHYEIEGIHRLTNLIPTIYKQLDYLRFIKRQVIWLKPHLIKLYFKTFCLSELRAFDGVYLSYSINKHVFVPRYKQDMFHRHIDYSVDNGMRAHFHNLIQTNKHWKEIYNDNMQLYGDFIPDFAMGPSLSNRTNQVLVHRCINESMRITSNWRLQRKKEIKEEMLDAAYNEQFFVTVERFYQKLYHVQTHWDTRKQKAAHRYIYDLINNIHTEWYYNEWYGGYWFEIMLVKNMSMLQHLTNKIQKIKHLVSSCRLPFTFSSVSRARADHLDNKPTSWWENPCRCQDWYRCTMVSLGCKYQFSKMKNKVNRGDMIMSYLLFFDDDIEEDGCIRFSQLFRLKTWKGEARCKRNMLQFGPYSHYIQGDHFGCSDTSI